MVSTQKTKDSAPHLGLLKLCARNICEASERTSHTFFYVSWGAGEGIDVTRSGEARVGLVDFFLVGKSTLLNKLTGTLSEVVSYELTTLTGIPGGIVYHSAKIQVSYCGVLNGLLEKIWEYLNLNHIKTKPKGMNPDYENPVILSSKKRTIEDFCERIHKDMVDLLSNIGLVWGSRIKHKPQRVGKEHELEDEDVVQVIKKV